MSVKCHSKANSRELVYTCFKIIETDLSTVFTCPHVKKENPLKLQEKSIKNEDRGTPEFSLIDLKYE